MEKANSLNICTEDTSRDETHDCTAYLESVYK
jgi:hypothetical protein